MMLAPSSRVLTQDAVLLSKEARFTAAASTVYHFENEYLRIANYFLVDLWKLLLFNTWTIDFLTFTPATW